MWEDGELEPELLVEEEAVRRVAEEGGLQAVAEVAADAEEVGVVVEDDHEPIFIISSIQREDQLKLVNVSNQFKRCFV